MARTSPFSRSTSWAFSWHRSSAALSSSSWRDRSDSRADWSSAAILARCASRASACSRLALLLDPDEFDDLPLERRSHGIGGLKSLGGLSDQLLEPFSILVVGLPRLVQRPAKLVDLRALRLAFLAKLLLAAAQLVAKSRDAALGLLARRSQPLQLAMLRGKLVIPLTELTGDLLVPGLGGFQLLVEMRDLASQLLACGMAGLELVPELLELRAKLVPFGEGRTTLVLVLLDLPAKLVPLGDGGLELVPELLDLRPSWFLSAWAEPT